MVASHDHVQRLEQVTRPIHPGNELQARSFKKGCVMALSNNVQEKAKLKLQILKSKAKKEQPLMELWKRVVHNSTLPVLRTAFSHRPLPPCPV